MFLTLLIATHVSILTSDTSRTPHGYPFAGLRNAPLPIQRTDDRCRISVRIETARRGAPASRLPTLTMNSKRQPVSSLEKFGILKGSRLTTNLYCNPATDNCPLNPAASVDGLSPVTSSAQDGLSRPVSCYAFFKGWLLLSQPPGCLGLPTSFPT